MKKFICFLLLVVTIGVSLGGFSAGLRNGWINIDTDGFFQMFGSGIVWDDVVGESFVGTVTALQPIQVTQPGRTITQQCFDDGGVTEIFGRFEKPHKAMVTGNISPHLHWLGDVTSSTATGVIFFTYSIVEPGKLPTAEITLTGYLSAGTVAWSGRVDDIDGDIYDSGVVLGGAMIYRVRRDASFAGDTYPGNICIQQVGLHYQIDRLGSRGERVR